uniref:Thioredoxin domain-containing protein n=1 Tax=Panagrolaimus sp. PS1159 TaxID=55785 RepID=A0AC35ETN7_9BILA
MASIVGAAMYVNLPLELIVQSDEPNIKELGDTKLIKIDEKTLDVNEQILAKDLFHNGSFLIWAVRNPECPFCHEEAKAFDLFKDKLNAAGVKFIAVVDKMNGIKKFKEFFNGDIYYDSQRNFYGSKTRWIYYWLRFFRIKSYFDALRYGKTVRQFEGKIAGGVYLINGNELNFYHFEKSWVDATNKNDIIDAIKNL